MTLKELREIAEMRNWNEQQKRRATINGWIVVGLFTGITLTIGILILINL